MNIKALFHSDGEFSPRNPWARAQKALRLAEQGRTYRARRELEHLRYHTNCTENVLDIFDRQIDALEAQTGAQAPLINIPSDYTSRTDLGLRAPFRQLRADAKVPAPYPPSLALPPLTGEQNDYDYLRDAATMLGPRLQCRLTAAHVFVAMSDSTNLPNLADALANQTFAGRIRLTVFGTVEPTFAAPERLEVDVVEDTILGVRANARLRDMLDESEDVLTAFLSGDLTLDRTFLARAAHQARVSDSVVQPLVLLKEHVPLQSVFTETPRYKLFSSRYPFRDMQGLNFVAPSGLLRDIGLLDTRFSSTHFAARELAFRMFMLGKYFVPLPVPRLKAWRDDKDAPRAEERLYHDLCPNHWDRKADGRFERPRVSVYIPAYNAARYIRTAIDSVLDQDFTDLEVCICNDGSRDGTAEILETYYANNPRVRWVTRSNGGIGFGSNTAVHLCRGLYIGQLDSDDVLKPGAVRRLATYLDEHPQAACVYGSCERIDADGQHVKNEYSWPTFSREKMMITSIAHHFRMFRRSAWERTSKFREDIVNGIDYDIFLKLSETGHMHHIDEILYQRRWHGENTSLVNEAHQTANTYRVQNEALKRLGLDRFWEISVPNSDEPRKVTYRRKEDTKTVIFWPDYSRYNPYQHMLYASARSRVEICAGDMDAALEQVKDFPVPSNLVFHLHWLNALWRGVADLQAAEARAADFLEKLRKFIWKGGQLVWTIHNHASHESSFHDIEIQLSGEIAKLAHVLHFHSAASVEEVAQVFDVPRDKVRIARHGHYIGTYPDFVDRHSAREHLGLAADEDVVLFTGQVRSYKGVETLVEVVRDMLGARPKLRLLIAGEMKSDPFTSLAPALTNKERARITATGRFVDDAELQLFFHAADVAVYPYQKILTSGSLMLALSFGRPVIVPDVGMTREVLGNTDAGLLYDGSREGLAAAIETLLKRKDTNSPNALAPTARAVAEALPWDDFAELLA